MTYEVTCPVCRGRGAYDSGSVNGGGVTCFACRQTGRLDRERVALLAEAALALRDLCEGRESPLADETVGRLTKHFSPTRRTAVQTLGGRLRNALVARLGRFERSSEVDEWDMLVGSPR